MSSRGPGCGCFGCVGSLLVLLALVGAAWLFVLKPAQDFLGGLRGPGQTQSRTAPTQTVGPAVTKAEVQKFVRVRRKVREALGPTFSELQTLLTQIQAGRTPNVLQVGTLLRTMTGSVTGARAARDAALETEGLSRERYAVLGGLVNRALGLPTVNFAQVAEALQRGQFPDIGSSVQTASQAEKALVAPFAKELRATAAAGLIGL